MVVLIYANNKALTTILTMTKTMLMIKIKLTMPIKLLVVIAQLMLKYMIIIMPTMLGVEREKFMSELMPMGAPLLLFKLIFKVIQNKSKFSLVIKSTLLLKILPIKFLVETITREFMINFAVQIKI